MVQAYQLIVLALFVGSLVAAVIDSRAKDRASKERQSANQAQWKNLMMLLGGLQEDLDKLRADPWRFSPTGARRSALPGDQAVPVLPPSVDRSSKVTAPLPPERPKRGPAWEAVQHGHLVERCFALLASEAESCGVASSHCDGSECWQAVDGEVLPCLCQCPPCHQARSLVIKAYGAILATR